MELGQRLKQARLEAGLSQRQLCGDTITRNMLSQIENGTARPSMDTLRYFADRLEKPVSFFLEETSPSPNQTRMQEARDAFAAGKYGDALLCLETLCGPDPVFDGERYLLEALCCLALARQVPEPGLLERAAAAGSQTPYYTPELERSRLLLLAEADASDPVSVANALPVDDRELLLRARAALAEGEPNRAAAILDAAREQEDPRWQILRGDAAFACGNYESAARYYAQAESALPQQAFPKLEQCYLRMEDYKMAYHYACKQR